MKYININYTLRNIIILTTQQFEVNTAVVSQQETNRNYVCDAEMRKLEVL